MSWELKSLENVCSLITDGAHWSPIDIGDGFPMPSVKDMTDNGFDYTNCKKISESDFLKLKNSNCSPKLGDVLIAKDGSYLKHCFSFNGEEEIAILSSIAIFRPNVNIIDSIFLEYLFRSPAIKSLATGYVSGVAVPRIVLKDFKKIQLPIPSLETQRRIASILSNYDDLIENNFKRIKLLEETAQNIYKEWFVNFRFPNYEHTAFDEVSGFPVGWEMKKLSELVILTMGQSPKSEFYNENKEGLPFHQGVTGYGHRFVSHSTYCSVVTRIAEEGDILFSVRAPVGRLNIAPERLIIGRGLSSIRNKRNCQSFQLYQLKNHFFQEDLIGGGAIFNSVTKNDLENQLMISPLNEVVDEFERIVKPIDEQIWKLNFQNQKLKEARDILLPRLMNRTIEV